MFAGYGDEILGGLMLTISVAVGAIILAVVFGLLGAGAKLSRSRTLRIIAAIYTTVIRGIPELVLIIVLYYGLPTVIQLAVREFIPGYRLDFNPYVTGITVLGLIYGAFMTEVLRAAFIAVPKGQMEAGRAVGLPAWRIFLRIHMPQMWRYALPGIGNIWMVLIKATALVSVIQLQELTFWTKRVGEITREPFLYLFVATALYLLITFLSERVLALAEKRASRGIRMAGGRG